MREGVREEEVVEVQRSSQIWQEVEGRDGREEQEGEERR